MASPRILFNFYAADYQLFKLLLPLPDDGLPASYDEWLRQVSAEEQRLTKRGESFTTVVLNPAEFAAYCRDTGQKPSRTMLEAFAVKEARKSA